jgi:transcriptional regulator with XRE-family HTH domain
MEFKDRIKTIREASGKSVVDFAKQLGKTESAIRMWEAGKNKPDANTLIELSKLFNCSTDYLLGLTEYRNRADYELLDEMWRSVFGTHEDTNRSVHPAMLKLFHEIMLEYRNLRDSDLGDEYLNRLYSMVSHIGILCQEHYHATNYLLEWLVSDSDKFSMDKTLWLACDTFEIKSHYMFLADNEMKGLFELIEAKIIDLYINTIGEVTGESFSRDNLKSMHEKKKKEARERYLQITKNGGEPNAT